MALILLHFLDQFILFQKGVFPQQLPCIRPPHNHKFLMTFPHLTAQGPSLKKHLSSNFEKIKEFSAGPRTEPMSLVVSRQEYDAVVQSLEAISGTIRYEYNWTTKAFVVYGNPSPAHEVLIYPLGRVFNEQLMGYVRAEVGSAQVLSLGQATMLLHKGNERTLDKGPDASFVITLDDGTFIFIVAEIGVSQSHKDLYRVARHYLCESDGEVVLVVLVKFTKPNNPERADDWKATMEFLSRWLLIWFSTAPFSPSLCLWQTKRTPKFR